MRQHTGKGTVLRFPRDRKAPTGKAPGQLEQRLFGEKLCDLEQRLVCSGRASEALAIIQRGFDDARLDLGRVSQACGVEQNHLNRLLREGTGLTFHQLLTRYRILKATRLLGRTDGAVLEVAISCGFSSGPTFYRNFRHLLGCTPRSFRKVIGWKGRKRSSNRQKSPKC